MSRPTARCRGRRKPAGPRPRRTARTRPSPYWPRPARPSSSTTGHYGLQPQPLLRIPTAAVRLDHHLSLTLVALFAFSRSLSDYRTIHRGGPNTTPLPRRVLYLTFGRRWFSDVKNFDRDSLFDPLPVPRGLAGTAGAAGGALLAEGGLGLFDHVVQCHQVTQCPTARAAAVSLTRVRPQPRPGCRSRAAGARSGTRSTPAGTRRPPPSQPPYSCND